MGADTANNNAGTAITQDNDGDADAIASGGNAVDDGAYVGTGNAIGEDADSNAVAHNNSTAAQIDALNIEAVAIDRSIAVENGGAVGGNGVAVGEGAADVAAVGEGAAFSSEGSTVDEGSAALVGSGNQAAAADDSSAAANQRSVALVAEEDIADDGASVVVGNGNSTASAEDGAAAVGGAGTAVGINGVSIGGDVTAAFGVGNVVSAAHLEEATVVSTELFINGGILFDEDGISFGAEAEVAGIIALGPNASITTGNINNNSLGSLTGANMFAGNTGLANQGDAIGIAANNSF